MDNNAPRIQALPPLPEEPPVSTEDGTGAAPEVGRRHHRSTIDFPYSHLGDAIALAGTIYERGGGQCGPDQLAAWLGHESIQSGTFRTKLAAARMFGLVEVNRDQVALTRLGQQIIDRESDGRQARVSAFLNVPLYSRVYDAYKGRQLPADAGLEQAIVNFGVSPKQRDKARQAFQRSAEEAGLFAQGRTRVVLPPGTVDTRGVAPPSGVIVPPGGVGAEGTPPPPPPPARSDRQGGSFDEGGNQGNREGRPLLLEGLFERLPAEGALWADQDREAWINAAQAVFNLVYKKAPDA